LRLAKVESWFGNAERRTIGKDKPPTGRKPCVAVFRALTFTTTVLWEGEARAENIDVGDVQKEVETKKKRKGVTLLRMCAKGNILKWKEKALAHITDVKTRHRGNLVRSHGMSNKAMGYEEVTIRRGAKPGLP